MTGPAAAWPAARRLLQLASLAVLGACGTVPFPTGPATHEPVVAAPPAAAAVAPAAPEPELSTAQVLAASIDHRAGLTAAPVDDTLLVALAAEADLPAGDLWARIRDGMAMPDLDNDLVRRQEQWYATRPDYVQRMTERSRRYLFHIVEELEQREMPLELALLPFIESAFNPQAVSTAQAAGMWQFIPSTGRHYELRQNLFRDDRRDVLASTRAALDYLQRLHGMFQDWHLALAAYNWGEGNVQRAIQRNRRAGLPAAYDRLRMPAETRHYVPKLQAIKNIVAQPELFGVNLPAIEDHPYFRSVDIRRDIDVALVAELAGLEDDEFRALNPSHNKPVILAAGTPQVLLPWDNATQFLKGLAAHKGKTASWTAWAVPRTMRPAEAAKEVGMPEADLREVNRIPPNMVVRAGSTLLVARNGRGHKDVSGDVADNARLSLAPERSGAQRMIVTARARDTATSIARKHGLSPADVARWNRVKPNAWFNAGHRVLLILPQESGVRTAAAAASTRATSAAAARAPASASTAPAATVASATRRVIVTAKRRDTATSIAREHGLSPADVARWNRVKPDAWFNAGHRVMLHLPQRPAARTASN